MVVRGLSSKALTRLFQGFQKTFKRILTRLSQGFYKGFNAAPEHIHHVFFSVPLRLPRLQIKSMLEKFSKGSCSFRNPGFLAFLKFLFLRCFDL